MEKYGSKDGCPGCTCVLLRESTVLPHLESCRARILGLMLDDEQGHQRIEEHKRKRKVVPEDKDVTLQESQLFQPVAVCQETNRKIATRASR